MASSFERQQRRKAVRIRSRSEGITTLQGLASYADGVGLGEEATKIIAEPKLSVLQRLGRGLTAFETGNAIYQSRYNDMSFVETYLDDIGSGLSEAVIGRAKRKKPRRTFKEILLREGAKDRPGKIDAIDVVGLAGDILTDPTTFLGGFIGKGVVKAGKVGFNISKKVPGVGKVITKGEAGTKALFRPFSAVEKLGKTGEKYRDAYLKYARGTRAEIDEFLTDMNKLIKPVKKEVGKKGVKKIGAEIAEAVETGTRTGDTLVDETMDALVAVQESMTKQEVSRGILKSQLDDYMHHSLTPEASDFLAQGGDLSQFVKPIRVKLGAAKERKIEGIVSDINKEYFEKLGFDLFEEDAFKAFAKRGLSSIKAVKTHDFLQKVGHTFGMGAKGREKFIDEVGVKWTKTGAKELDDILLPEQIAKHVDETRKIFANDEATNSLLRFYDKSLAIFKASVTGWFPAFHTRNAMGGMFNNWIAGIKNPATYKKSIDILNKKSGFLTKADGSQISYDAIRELSKEFGVVGQTGYLDVAEFLQKEINPTIANQLLKAPQRFMGMIEDNLRMPLFMDGLQKGLTPGEASRRVIQFHFDYMPEGFSQFEKNIMKRLIPFYTWTRHNIPLQIEQIIKQPGKYAGVFKTQRAWGVQPSTDEEAVLPIWLRERYTIKDEGGYWSGIGIPLEEATEKLSQPLRGFGISMSPFLKVPIEQLTGFNIFKDRRIEEDRFGKVYKNAPEFIQDWLQLKKHTNKKGKDFYTLNPKRRYWLEVIGMRGLSTALRVSNAVDDRMNLMTLVTTIRKFNYSVEDLKRWSDTEKRQELEKLLIQQGELAEFKRTYVPKQNRSR